MKKEIFLTFIKELIVYIVAVVILCFLDVKMRLDDTTLLDNIIGLTIGWIVWKTIMLIIDKRKDKK